MTPGRLHPLDDGRWLLRGRRRRYLLPAELGLRISAGEADRELDELLAAAERRRGFRLLRGLKLLPAAVTARAAAPLVPLVRWPVLIAVAALGIYGAAWGWAAPPHGSVNWPAFAVLLATAGLTHELGHAAALLRGGGRPGAVGAGLMVVLPVLWCDVSETALLGRRDRLRVDLAGPLLHLGVVGAYAATARIAGWATADAAARAGLLAAVWSLLPLVRSDGAWALADLLGLDALEAPSSPDASPRLRTATAAVRAIVAAAIAAVTLLLPWRLGSRLSFLFAGPPAVDLLAGAALTGLGVLIAKGAGRRARSLIVSAKNDVYSSKKSIL